MFANFCWCHFLTEHFGTITSDVLCLSTSMYNDEYCWVAIGCMCMCVRVQVDYETWTVKVDVMFNVSESVDGWIELRIVQLGFHHQQRVLIDVNSTIAHIVTSVAQVQ